MALGHPSSRNTVEACCAPEYALEVHEPRHRSVVCGLEIGRVSRRTGVSRAKDGEDHAIYDQREAGTAEVAYACRCSTCFAIHLQLTGTKKGCDQGACTVLVDGHRINSLTRKIYDDLLLGISKAEDRRAVVAEQ
jgi:hypothetical protein